MCVFFPRGLRIASLAARRVEPDVVARPALREELLHHDAELLLRGVLVIQLRNLQRDNVVLEPRLPFVIPLTGMEDGHVYS